MSGSKQLGVRNRIAEFVKNHQNWEKNRNVKHFVEEGIIVTTIYRTINRIQKGMSVDRKPGSGSKGAILKKIKNKIIENCVNEVGISYRYIGRKHGISHHSAKKILLESGVERRQRVRCPKTTEKQALVQKQRLHKLARTYFKADNNIVVIMDDESYFTTDGSDTNLNNNYYTHPSLELPDTIKYHPKAKYPQKVLVWVAISEKGISEPYIAPSGNAVTAAVYIKECLPKLVDFINKYHSNDNYVFWPDLASAHYAKLTLKAYEDMNVKYLPKDVNPPNVPQLRPIETFWSNLQQKLYFQGWTSDNIEKLVRRIRYIMRETSPQHLRNLMEGVPVKVRAAANKGVLSVINR